MRTRSVIAIATVTPFVLGVGGWLTVKTAPQPRLEQADLSLNLMSVGQDVMATIVAGPLELPLRLTSIVLVFMVLIAVLKSLLKTQE